MNRMKPCHSSIKNSVLAAALGGLAILFAGAPSAFALGNTTRQEYGDAIYRYLYSVGWARNYNHAGLFAGQSGGVKRCIEADTLVGDTTHDNSLSDSFSGHGSDYYGAFTLNNVTLTFSQRKAIMATAKQVEDAYIYYTYFSALDPITSARPVTVANIDNLRCDGVVEYCYESNGFQSWWHTSYPSRWQISNYPEEHNDAPDLTVNPESEESPWAQRGAPPSSAEGPGYSGPNPGNARLTQPAVTGLPTYLTPSYSRINATTVDVTITATDESGIAYIGYKMPGASSWSHTAWQAQHPMSDTYAYVIRITNAGTLYYFAEDNGGNFPSSAPGVSFYNVSTAAGPGGTISPSGRALVPYDDRYAFSASPGANYSVDKWYLDGTVVQTGGNSYTLSNVQTNRSVHVTFTLNGVSDNLPPSLAIAGYTNLQVVPGISIVLSGTASDAGRGDSGLTNVTVNGLPATNRTAVGSGIANWSRGVRLVAGTNTFTVVATDGLGNRTNVSIRLISDASRPSLTISAPTLNQRWSNAVLTVKGTARDNRQVAGVQYQLNGGAWTSANSANGWSNWTAEVTLLPGTNRISAYAADAAGNRSPTNNVKVVYVLSDRLVLAVTGRGTVSPNYSNALLQIGQSYKITATPAPGYVLSNWMGGTTLGDLGVLANTATLSFVMQSNLVLRANLIPNPFIPVKGSYNGLFAEQAGRAQDSSGLITLVLTDKGVYTGTLKRGANTYTLSGQFDAGGAARKTVARPGTNAWFLAMQLDFGAQQLAGTVSNGVRGGWVAELLANRGVFSATNPATQYAGKYTMIIPGATNEDGSVALGDGYAALTVLSNGMASLSGSLADSTNFTQGVPVSQDGQLPMYASLYGGKGSVWGWLLFDTNQPSASLEGTLSWIKPAQAGARYYPGGFTNEVEAVGLRYRPPIGATNRVMALTNGVIVFEGGNLVAPFTNAILLTASNRVVNLSSNKLSVTLTLSSGLFSGSATAPGTGRTVSFKGALMQQEESGCGYFLGTNQSGAVLLGRAPQ